jgi:hypothetical protein
MINKIYKRIHKNYSKLLKFIFLLRYLIGIFFISAVLFLIIPYFFDFKENDSFIKNHLLANYGLALNNYKNIKYTPLPTPSLKIQNASLSMNNDAIRVDTVSLIIYPKSFNIYNEKNFKISKIIFNKSNASLSDSDLKDIIKYIKNLKKKLTFKNLDLKIKKNNSTLINLNKIYFTNYGYNKDIIRGVLFDKQFKLSIKDNYNKIKFELLKTGIIADINFDDNRKETKKSGILKSTLLNSKLKFNFEFDDTNLKIYNSYFRNRFLSFKNESVITYLPFFSTSSKFTLENININQLKEININKFLASKNLIKKLNSKNDINFKSKKFDRILIDDINLNINLAYGRLVYSQKISIAENIFLCRGEVNLLEEFPILYFDCSIVSKDKKRLLKEFSIKYKNKNELFKLYFTGNINILNNKINFKKISLNQDYLASKEDLGYFKGLFEDILYDEGFLRIFNFKKIKEFILEIS